MSDLSTDAAREGDPFHGKMTEIDPESILFAIIGGCEIGERGLHRLVHDGCADANNPTSDPIVRCSLCGKWVMAKWK